MAESKLQKRFRAARNAAVPLIAISTPDPAATIRDVCAVSAHKPKNGDAAKETPLIVWDVVNGVVGRNEAGLKAIVKCWPPNPQTGENGTKNNLMKTLVGAGGLPERSILFVQNSHAFVKSDQIPHVQATWNLRDCFKTDNRTLILLAPQFPLPDELRNGDVVELDEPLPDDDALRGIIRREFGRTPPPFEHGDEVVEKLAQSMKGCAAFGAEQTMWMNCTSAGVDWAGLSCSVQKTIEQTAGLVYESGTETFSDIGGLEFAKRFGEQMFAGPRRPALIVRVEELEKSMAGAAGDLSGTSQDSLQVMLSEMEDNEWSGLLAVGPAGSGKSLYSKALARTFDARPIRFDLNACKGSLVGESGRKIRAAMKVIKTIGGDRVFFIASVNRLDGLPPELKRRFRRGLWFFDLPNEQDRKRIWQIQRKRWSIDIKDKAPDEDDLTGADIRNICETAYSQGISLKDAMQFVVPLKVQDPDSIEAARRQANGRYIDANKGGVYKLPTAETAAAGRGRSFEG